MVLEVPPPKLNSSGTVFVKYSADGGSFAFYSSGNMACAYERMGGGYYAYFYADDQRGTTLAAIDPFGCGFCAFPNGRPRLTSRKTGGTYSSEDGKILRLWTGLKPLDKNNPIEFDLSSHIKMTFGSRQHITATLTVAGLTEVYHLGEVPKMAADSYLAKATHQIRMGPERGKYMLNIDKCRIAADENRERREAMMMKDLGPSEVHITEESMQKHPELRPIVGATTDLQASIGRGEWDIEVYVSKEAMNKTLNTTQSLMGGVSLLQGTAMSSYSPKLYGEPRRSSEGKLPRKRLIEFSYKKEAYDEELKSLPKDACIVVCCLADWMPQCRRMTAVLESLNGRLALEGKGMGATATGTFGNTELPNMILRKFETTKSKLLLERFNITQVPMFLMYVNNRLAFASNTFNGYGTGQEDLITQVRETLVCANRGQFLPEGFKFGRVQIGKPSSH